MRRAAVGTMLVVVLVGLGGLPATAAPTSSHVQPRIHVLPHATVRSGGVAAVVQMTVACSGLTTRGIEISVDQQQADGTLGGSSGFASLDKPCTKTPQLVRAAVEMNGGGEDASWPPARILTPGSAVLLAFTYCLSDNFCEGYYYPPQPIVLIDSPALDRLHDAYGSIAPKIRPVARGAAADLTGTVRCLAGRPSRQVDDVTLTQRIRPLWQYGFKNLVQAARPLFDPVDHPCPGASQAYTQRLYADLRPLVAGRAWIDSGDLWGEVDVG